CGRLRFRIFWSGIRRSFCFRTEILSSFFEKRRTCKGEYHMNFQDAFPIWHRLKANEQKQILNTLISRTVKKGTVLHNGDADCTGLLLVKSGQLRAYILSDEGREITLYRLFDRDLCL